MCTHTVLLPCSSGFKQIWQICGDFLNASKFHDACNPLSEPNPAGLESWGSVARNNVVDGDTADTRTAGMRGTGSLPLPLPVMPWVVVDHT